MNSHTNESGSNIPLIDVSESVSQGLSERLRKRQQRLFISLILASCLCFLGVVVLLKGPGLYARWTYAPKNGDIIFQSLKPSPLVIAIEGVTESSFSHCGIVFSEGNEFYVCEAFGSVEVTPLKEFLKRGREEGFAVYRLQKQHQKHIPSIINAAKSFLGHPYDVRYRMDDEKIYCSELIYKAWLTASPKQPIGRMRKLGDMNWQPYEETIRYFEQGPVPLDREMITPVDLALAEEFELLAAFRIRAP